ncbi:MAG: conjugal transfer protein TraM, partial [Chitinophagaceae bacterium]
METRTRDRRRILLVLPLLVVPFLALAFYAGGGGRGSADEVAASTGINTALPHADFKTEDPVDKMGFYARGEKDTASSAGISGMAGKMGFGAGVAADEHTAEINAKLAALNKEINSLPADIGGSRSSASGQAPKNSSENISGDVERLEMLMQSMKADKAADPEMEQMNSMLEKLL